MRKSSQRWMLELAVAALLPIAAAQAAETDEAVRISVQDAVGKVGDPVQVIARVEALPGFVIAENYRNAIFQLSAEDQAVTFPNKRVRATVQNGALVFKVNAVPKKPGPHPINGVLRFAFVGERDGKSQLDIKTAPLMATVTGQE